jgi:hypothetical protein
MVTEAVTADSLEVTIVLNKEEYDKGEIITISGQIQDANGNPVSNAVISIQVNDPDGKMVHIAMKISNQDGEYYDQFIIANNSLNGSYTVFVTGSKSGYSDITRQTNYTVIPEFSKLFFVIFSAFSLMYIINKRFQPFVSRALLPSR